MTHPLTPHEKVRQIVDCALNSAIPEPWEVANHATDAIITALASGSGDHAELAKRLRASKRNRHGIYGRVLVNPDGPAAADALEALIAEVAAMRAANTEAERKLAEAVELLKQALGDMDRRVITAETANRIDYFISKEAERGCE